MNRWGERDRSRDDRRGAGGDHRPGAIAQSDCPRGKDPRSMNYPFLGGGYGGDAVRCQLDGETLVCRLTRKYHFVYGLLLTVFGPYMTTVGVHKLYEAWTAQPKPDWTTLLLTLWLVVFGTAMCAVWIIQFFHNATIRFDFAEGIVEFRMTGLIPYRWRFRLQDVSAVGVERRITLQDSRILLTEDEYARQPHKFHVNGKIYWLMLTFADGSSVKAFETSRPDVADFAAQCIAERLAGLGIDGQGVVDSF